MDLKYESFWIHKKTKSEQSLRGTSNLLEPKATKLSKKKQSRAEPLSASSWNPALFRMVQPKPYKNQFVIQKLHQLILQGETMFLFLPAVNETKKSQFMNCSGGLHYFSNSLETALKCNCFPL